MQHSLETYRLGRKFGRWTVLGPSDRKPFYMRCQCECGTTREVYKYDLKSGHNKSCGCWDREVLIKRNTTHGMKGTRVYAIWQGMKDRCHNPNSDTYEWYGARGIIVCARWRNSFENFFADMGHPPPGLSIDRRDNEKNYTPDNCRWADAVTQANNRRPRRKKRAVLHSDVLADRRT